MSTADTGFTAAAGVVISLNSKASLGAQQSLECFGALHGGNVIDAHLDVNALGLATGTGLLEIYAYADSSGAGEYTDKATGADADFAVAGRLNSVLVGVVQMNEATAVKAGPFSIAAAFGGFVPKAGGFIVVNNSGAALGASGNTLKLTAVNVSAA